MPPDLRLTGEGRWSGRVPRLFLFPFRFRSPITGKWVRARYVAEREVIAARYAEWEIIGPLEIRDVDPQAARFNPYRPRAKRFRHPVYEAS